MSIVITIVIIINKIIIIINGFSHYMLSTEISLPKNVWEFNLLVYKKIFFCRYCILIILYVFS